jgi:hypothetical protein
MRVKIIVRTLLVGLVGTSLSAQQPGTTRISPQTVPSGALYGKLPLTFEANRGQSNTQVDFLSRGKGYTALLTTGGMVLNLRPAPVVNTSSSVRQQITNTTLQFRLLGANRNPVALGEDLQPGVVNYFIGNNPAQWHRNVPTYARVRYKNVYPGIDLIYYGNHQQLEYDFAVSPGTDPRQIQFEIKGASQIALDGEGNLVLSTESGELHFQAPLVYQESNGQRAAVGGGYVMRDATHIGFHVAHYDSSRPLLIDPVLVYSTYLGGTGNDQPTGIAVDNSGSVYIAGYTDSANFPLATLGSLPPNTNHVFVAKLDATGSNLVYADYIGGNSQDYGIALVLDAANAVYVTGSTASSNFPVVQPFQAQQPGPYSGFLTKISANGSSLLYSTYLGGNTFDQPTSIGIDSLAQVYVAGYTKSQNFPVANAFQPTVSANQANLFGDYGFLTKFSPDGSSLVYSTYLAGNSNVVQDCGSPCWPSPYNVISGIAVDANGSAYVTGTTNTYNFPTTAGSYLTSNTTQQDANIGFVSKFSSSGSLDYSTYFYGSSSDPVGISAIAVDGSGSAYITGTAVSDGTFPITSTGICDPGTYGFGCSYAFVTKFDPAASTLLYSTFLGLNNYASPQAIVLDADNDAYVLAATRSATFGTTNGIESYTNEMDILLVEIDPTASTERFATYLGGSGNDQPAGMALDPSGNIYLAGSTVSTDFPTTAGAFQSVLGGGTDAFIAKIGATSAPSVSLSPYSLTYASLAIGSTSPPQTVLLRNMGSSPLAISSIVVSGDFAELDNCGTSVPAAGSCTFSVTFTPSAAGVRSGSVVIQDNAAGATHVLNLSGLGFGAGAALNPASLTFSAQPVGTSSAAQAVTFTDTGNATLNISTIQVTGDFAQINNCPASLAPASSCAINVTFTPTVSGTRNGTLIISDNAQGTPQIANLTGTGSAAPSPVVVLTPASLTFPSQPLTSSSAAQSVTLANTGNAALNIGSIQVTGDFAQVNNCPSNLVPATSCAINVTFTPTAPGTRNGSLIVNDNAQDTPQTATLTGTGSGGPGPAAILTPSSLTFATQPLTSSSAAQSVTLANTGNATLNVGRIQMSGDYLETNNCQAQLQPSTSCTINVTFSPKATGTRNGTVTVNDNASGNLQTVTLTGSGSDFSMASSPSSDTVTGGGSATYTVNVSSIGGSFSHSISLSCSGLPVQASCSFSPAVVNPSASGQSSTLTITTSTLSAQATPVLPSHRRPAYAIYTNLQGLGFAGIFLAGSKKRSRRWLILTLLVLLVLGMLFMTGCAAGVGTSPQNPPKTYTVTATGTYGTLQHSLPLTLTVQ